MRILLVAAVRPRTQRRRAVWAGDDGRNDCRGTGRLQRASPSDSARSSGQARRVEPVRPQDLVVRAALGDASTPTRRVRAAASGADAASALSTASPWPAGEDVVVEADDRAAGVLRKPGAVDRPQPRQCDQAPAVERVARGPAPARRAPGPAQTNVPPRPRAGRCRGPPRARRRGRIEAEWPWRRDEPEVDGAVGLAHGPVDRAAYLGSRSTARSPPSPAPSPSARCRAPTGASGRARRGRGRRASRGRAPSSPRSRC